MGNSLDHLVGAQLEFATDREPKRLGGLQVDGKLELGRLLDRNIGWPRRKLSRPVFSALFPLRLLSVRRSSLLPKAVPLIH